MFGCRESRRARNYAARDESATKQRRIAYAASFLYESLAHALGRTVIGRACKISSMILLIREPRWLFYVWCRVIYFQPRLLPVSPFSIGSLKKLREYREPQREDRYPSCKWWILVSHPTCSYAHLSVDQDDSRVRSVFIARHARVQQVRCPLTTRRDDPSIIGASVEDAPFLRSRDASLFLDNSFFLLIFIKCVLLFILENIAQLQSYYFIILIHPECIKNIPICFLTIFTILFFALLRFV